MPNERRWHRKTADAREIPVLRGAEAIRRARSHNQRAVRLGRPGQITGALLALLWVAQDAACFYCRTPLCNDWPDDHWHVDHLIPLCDDGTNEPANIVIACPRCNESKTTMRPLDWSERGHHPLRIAA